MPILFEVEPSEGYLTSKWVGPIRHEEVVRSYRAFFESDAWMPGLNELADFSQADLSHVPHFVLMQLGTYAEAFYKQRGITEVKVAVWAPHNLPREISELYRALAYDSPESLHIFRARDEAISWVTKEQAHR
jgi:hypothetical protein